MSDIAGLALVIWVAAAWLTHVVVSIQTTKWLLLLVGAIFFPVGCVHGTGIWFGVF
jgi:hypothetical protein